MSVDNIEITHNVLTNRERETNMSVWLLPNNLCGSFICFEYFMYVMRCCVLWRECLKFRTK